MVAKKVVAKAKAVKKSVTPKAKVLPTKAVVKVVNESDEDETETDTTSKVVERYGLYYTLNGAKGSSSTPSTSTSKSKSKDLSPTQRNKLATSIKSMDAQRSVAVLMLIFEHANSAGVEMLVNDKFVPPYGVVQRGKNVAVDIDALPVELKWVLWKFSQIA